MNARRRRRAQRAIEKAIPLVEGSWYQSYVWGRPLDQQASGRYCPLLALGELNLSQQVADDAITLLNGVVPARYPDIARYNDNVRRVETVVRRMRQAAGLELGA